jgi:hypothetical protein
VDTKFVVVTRPERHVIASARGADACGSNQEGQTSSSSVSALGKPGATASPALGKTESHAQPSRAHGVLGAKFAKDAVGAVKSIPSLLFVLLGIAIGVLGVAALPSRLAPTRQAALALALHRGALALTGTALLIAVLVAASVVYALP